MAVTHHYYTLVTRVKLYPYLYTYLNKHQAMDFLLEKINSDSHFVKQSIFLLVLHVQVLLQKCLDAAVSRITGTWVVESDQSGFFTLYLASSLDNPYTKKRCLAVKDANTKSGTTVESVECKGWCAHLPVTSSVPSLMHSRNYDCIHDVYSHTFCCASRMEHYSCAWNLRPSIQHA